MKRRKVLFYKKNKQDKWLLLNENAAAFDVSSAANPNDASISGCAAPPTEAIKPDLPEDNSTADKTPDEAGVIPAQYDFYLLKPKKSRPISKEDI